jgi:minor extracellular serine protease Vpr
MLSVYYGETIKMKTRLSQISCSAIIPLVVVSSSSWAALAHADESILPVLDLSHLTVPDVDRAGHEAPARYSTAKEVIAAKSRSGTGEVEVVVRLSTASLAEQFVSQRVQIDPSSRANGSALRAYRGTLQAQQDTLVDRIQALGGRPLARLTKALNAVVIRVDASLLPEIAQLPGVAGIRPVGRYELHLGETVPYIGAAQVQSSGFDGQGIRVAVLDSGIDYLHRNLGGAGDPSQYLNNDPTIIEAGTFPTGKVVGGYDFVGNAWPSDSLAPDSDPLDDGPAGGHGTHVADIIAGRSSDGTHVGVAPGAS